MAEYGGEYVVRGGEYEVMEGEIKGKRKVVIRFKSIEGEKDW